MSAKWLKVTIGCVLVCVGLSCGGNAQENDKDYYTEKELMRAFDELERYLSHQRGLDDDEVLVEVAKDLVTQYSEDSHVGKAAEIVVYLSEFKECTPKAVKYMHYALHELPDTEIGWHISHWLEELLEPIVDRAKARCKSFMNKWHDQSERRIELASKQRLYNYFSREVIAQSNGARNNHHGALLFNAVQRDAKANKQLAKLQAEPQLSQFYQTYWGVNFVKPCEKFLEAMGDVMRLGSEFHLGQTRTDIFDAPSAGYMLSLFRYNRCNNRYYRSIGYSGAAQWAARKTLLGRNS